MVITLTTLLRQQQKHTRATARMRCQDMQLHLGVCMRKGVLRARSKRRLKCCGQPVYSCLPCRMAATSQGSRSSVAKVTKLPFSAQTQWLALKVLIKTP